MEKDLRTKINEVKFEGKILFVEDLVSILRSCGFDSKEADTIRKVYAKKKINDIELYNKKITEKLGEELGNELIDLIYISIGGMIHKSFSNTVKTEDLNGKIVLLKIEESEKIFIIAGQDIETQQVFVLRILQKDKDDIKDIKHLNNDTVKLYVNKTNNDALILSCTKLSNPQKAYVLGAFKNK